MTRSSIPRKPRGPKSKQFLANRQETLWLETEAAAAQGRCQALLSPQAFAELQAQAEAEYLTPWERLDYWEQAEARVRAQHSPAQPKPHLDWQRIEALSSQINVIARHWAARTGCEVGDIEQMMTLAIAEQAAQQPGFLDQTDNYILTRGSWRAVDAVRKHWRDDNAGTLDDAPLAAGGGLGRLNLEDIVQALSEQSRALLRAIVAAGETVLKVNGTLNISALARTLGLSNSTARRRVDLLRHELVVAGYGFS
jgi:hypothetical protein